MFQFPQNISQEAKWFNTPKSYTTVVNNILWNTYPEYVCSSIINRLNLNGNRNDNVNTNKYDRKVIWINLPYLGKNGEQVTNSLIGKLK